MDKMFCIIPQMYRNLLRSRALASVGQRLNAKNYHTVQERKGYFQPNSCVSFEKEQFYSPQCLRFFSTENGSSTNDSQSQHEEEASQEEAQKSEEEIREEILENALNFVVEHGWSRESLAMGAEEAGYASVAEGMFSRGGVDLVLHVVKSNNRRLEDYLKEEMEKEQPEKPNTSTFIRNALEYRLRMIIPFIDVWPEAMALLLRPDVLVDSTKELTKMVDDIWYYAGDKSTDFNWYTKRGLLAKLYVTMQSVMINDQSPDFTDSWEFLDRRMKDIETFGKLSRNVQKFGQMGADVAFAGFTVLRNVAGMGERKR